MRAASRNNSDERVGDAGERQKILAAGFMFAGERDFGDAEAGGIGGLIAEVLHLRDDVGDVIALDCAVAGAGEQQQRRRRRAGAARHVEFDDRVEPALRQAQPAETRGRPRL